ncbi:hypothetical protein JCM10908_003885 [Rhodotorula pacifica]|uniref:histone deacetylase n=1 Tax=Rhodotorula pacifica TaxID=1495444 RepID=UPI0031784D45
MTDLAAVPETETAASNADLLLAESLISLSLNTAATPAPTLIARPRTAVLFQPACTQHRYIRTADASTIVERPERIRAVKVGVAAAWARLERHQHAPRNSAGGNDAQDDGELDALLQGLSLQGGAPSRPTGEIQAKRDFKGKQRAREVYGGAFDILDSAAQLPVDHAALRYIHSKPNRPPGDDDDEEGWESASTTSTSSASRTPVASAAAGSLTTTTAEPKSPRAATPPWPEQLRSLCRASSSLLSSPSASSSSAIPSSSTSSPRASSFSAAAAARPKSEIPLHLPQGDLYLSPGSEAAIFGALGACCEGVDRIVAGSRVGRTDAVASARTSRAGVGGGEQEEERYDRAFVAIRPPGHHCGEANPQGFCFVNNVAVAAAHAHLEHGVDRVVIFDIDLHHGNGTQEIAWRINAEAHDILEARERERQRQAAMQTKTPRSSPRKSSPRKGSQSGASEAGEVKKEEGEVGGKAKEEEEKNPLRIMYASLHDIWSYPCEDGDPALVAAASLVLTGGHGQYISNVHLEPWETEADFHERLYPRYREGLIGKAEEFVRLTKGAEEKEEDARAKTLVIVSLGCDASEHESAGMSRHNRNVPTSFYRRFALDAVAFAQQHADGKCLAVLEGGYSDRALASASAAFLCGFAGEAKSSDGVGTARRDVGQDQERDAWWTESYLKKLEKACAVAKSRRGAQSSWSAAAASGGASATLLAGAADSSTEPWLSRAVDVFAHLEDTAVASSITASLAPGGTSSTADLHTPRQLRDRKGRAPINYASLADGSSPLPSPVRASTTSLRRPASSSRLRNEAVAATSASAASATIMPPPVPLIPATYSDKQPDLSSDTSASLGSLPPTLAITASESIRPVTVSAPSTPPTFAAPPATIFDGVADIEPEPSAETAAPSVPAAVGKPAIRFTWKQGGFGGEPRM